MKLADVVQAAGRCPQGFPQIRGKSSRVELEVYCLRNEDTKSSAQRFSVRVTLEFRPVKSVGPKHPNNSVLQIQRETEWTNTVLSLLKVDCEYVIAVARVKDGDAIWLRRIVAALRSGAVDDTEKPMPLGTLQRLKDEWVDEAGYTLLHWAAERGHIDCVRCLVDPHTVGTMISETLLDVQESCGNTALHLACKHNRHDVAMYLLRLGANHRIQNCDSQNVSDLARGCSVSMKKSIDTIIRIGTAHVLCNVEDDGGTSLLSTIVHVLRPTSSELLGSDPHIMMAFLRKGGCSCTLALLSRDDNPHIQVEASKATGHIFAVLDEHSSNDHHLRKLRLALLQRLVGHLANSTGPVQRAAAATLARDARTKAYPSCGADFLTSALNEREDVTSSQLALLATLHKEHPHTEHGPVLRESDLVRLGAKLPDHLH